MEHVTSADGTAIAYEIAGTGHPIIFSAGIFNDHHRLAPLAHALAPGFTTVSYDRRGRGASGDTRPYAIDREVEDLAALIDRVGGAAAVFGYSSGAILALYGAGRLPLTHLILFEPPFLTGRDPDPTLPVRVDALVAAGRRGEAVETLQAELIGMSPEMIAGAKSAPFWPALEAMAQAAVYDATIVMQLPRPADVVPASDSPRPAATVLDHPGPAATAALGSPGPAATVAPGSSGPAATGGDLPVLIMHGAGTWPALKQAAADLAAAMPGARSLELADGAHHDVPVESTAAAVREFISSAADE